MENEGVGMLAKKCMECTHANSIGDCEGKTQNELTKLPCFNFEFDTSVLEDEPESTEAVQPRPPLTNEDDDAEDFVAEQAIKDVVKHQALDKPENETPADRFDRISDKRLKRALYELKLLSNFGKLRIVYTRKDGSQVLQYEWTQEQADAIVDALQKSVDIVKHQLSDKAKK